MSNEAKLQRLKELLEQYRELKRTRALDFFQPTAKQMEFFRLGTEKRFRLLAAGNQCGKSIAGAFEMALHLTGLYPDWWPGIRFDRPIHAWAVSVSAAMSREAAQRHLLGRGRDFGTGMIPHDHIEGVSMARNVTDAVDTVRVKHVSGGTSTLTFKAFEQGREKLQGATLDLVWIDEEPTDQELFFEIIARLTASAGPLYMTFTPLMGYTRVVKWFFEPDPDDPSKDERGVVHMTLDDATFYDEEHRRRIEATYPEHERRARIMGLPAIGEGLIYPFRDEDITCDPFRLPPYYRRIAGIDFGIDHPTACIWVAWNPDTDTAYVYDEYRAVSGDIAVHAAAIKQRGDWPVAWPHDGLKRMAQEGGDSKPLIDLWRKFGVKFLPQSARYDPKRGGAQPKEPIIAQCRERFASGRLKIFSTCRDLLRELKSYHRKDGKPVAYNDDLISAMHYAIMSLRYARPATEMARPARAADDYDPLRWSPTAGPGPSADSGARW